MIRALAVVALLAGLGCSGVSASECKAKVARMKEILAEPYDPTAGARRLPGSEHVDGVGRTQGAVVVQFSLDPEPTVRVGDFAPVPWDHGAAMDQTLDRVMDYRVRGPASTDPLTTAIELDAPFAIDALEIAPLLVRMSPFGPLRILVDHPVLVLTPDAPPWAARAMKQALGAPPEERATAWAHAFERAAGACKKDIEAAIGSGRLPDRVAEDARLIASVSGAVEHCGCDDTDPIAVAAMLHALIAGEQLGWIEVRFDPEGTLVPYNGTAPPDLEMIVRLVSPLDRDVRTRGVDIGAK